MQVNKPDDSSRKIDSNQTTRNCADLLIDYLHQLNIDFVFGTFEDPTHYLSNALQESTRAGKTRHIETHHIASAVSMAAGYTENTCKLGVCIAGTNSAITQAIPEITTAYENDNPLLLISLIESTANLTQTKTHSVLNTQANAQPSFNLAGCTVQSHFVYDGADFENSLCAAILAAMQANKPTHICIASHLLKKRSTATKPSYQVAKHIVKTALLDKNSQAELEAILLRSKNVVFILGSGARSGIKEILAFASIRDASIISTASGKGYINPYHERYRGTLHQAGHLSAEKTLLNTENEIYIAIGVPPAEWSMLLANFTPTMANQLIHIDCRPERFAYTPMAKLHVQADTNELFTHILLACKTQHLLNTTPANTLTFDSLIKENKYKYYFSIAEDQLADDAISPQKLLHELPQLFPPKTRYIIETGQCQQWAIHYLHPHDRRLSGHRDDKAGLYQSSACPTAPGWSVNHAIGTALAFSDTPVICITDTTSFLNHCDDVKLALHEELTIFFVIFNFTKTLQTPLTKIKGNRHKTTDSTPNITDFTILGEALNIVSHVIYTHQDLLYLPIKDICKRRGPTLIDVHIE